MINTRFRFLLLGIACSLLAALCFLPGLDGGFVFDDNPNIVQNTALHVTTLDIESLSRAVYSFQPGGGSRALPELTFALDHWRAGLDPAAFKTTNLAIHAITTLALACFLRTLLLLARWPSHRAVFGAVVIASAWAIHPLQVSSVLYVVQRMQTMATLFVVLALWAYVLGRQAQITGTRSRSFWIATALFAALAFACKEDAVLLPVYTLLLEATLLRFRARDTDVSRLLRRGYVTGTVIGVIAFVAIVVPHYWHWGDYPARDFSTAERLLTQGRVLALYLGQILWPLPDRMPFYYDNLMPSRGLFQPWSTLPALALIVALLAVAWRMRRRLPLTSFGILFFFAGHLLTSNVVGLELAFEHRNHLPLIGATLAIADIIRLALQRLSAAPWTAVGVCLLLLSGEAMGTWSRSTDWGNPDRFARHSAAIAPGSARAWIELCGRHYVRSGKQPGPELDRAIAACKTGGDRTGAPPLLANVVLFKTIRGDVDQTDWQAYLDRLSDAPMSPENKQTVWVLVVNASRGVPLEANGVLKAIDIVARRSGFSDVEYARLGYFILDDTDRADEAYTYLALAVQASPAESPLPEELIADLAQRGRDVWSRQLARLAASRE